MCEAVQRRNTHRNGRSGIKPDGDNQGDTSKNSNPAVAEDNAEEGPDVQEKIARDPQGHIAQVVTRAGEKVLRYTADHIAESIVPAYDHGILCDTDPRTESRSLDDFSELHIVDDFHGQPPMCAAALIRRAFHQLEGADPYIEGRTGAADPVRIVGKMKNGDEENDQGFLPETNHFHVAEEREVVQVALRCESNGAAENVRFQANVSVSKEQPLAIGLFVSFLEGMRLAEPAGREIGNVNDPKPRMQSGEIIEDAAGGIFRTVINGDYLKGGVIDIHQRGKRGGQFFFFVTRGEEDRDARAIGIAGRRDILDHRKMQRAVSNVDAVENPERSDTCAENQSEKMHGNWC